MKKQAVVYEHTCISIVCITYVQSCLTTAAKNFTGPLKGPINDSYQCMPNKKTALYQLFLAGCHM